MRFWTTVVGGLLLGACAREDAHPPATVQSRPTAAEARRSGTRVPGPPTTDTAAVRGGCSALRALLESLKAAVHDSAQVEAVRDTSGVFPRHAAGSEFACTVSYQDAVSGLWLNDTLRARLGSKGWRMREDVAAADGPDGSVLAYSQAGAACVLRSGWDGDDDEDSSYVPVRGLTVHATCFADRRVPRTE